MGWGNLLPKEDKTLKDAEIQLRGKSLEALGKDSASDQLSDKGVELTQFKNRKTTDYVALGLTRQEALKRINKSDKKFEKMLDLEARKKIVDAGGDVKPNLMTKIKDIAPDHIKDNPSAYLGGAAAVGLGAYALKKYLNKRKSKKNV